jgi:PKD repeat protein
MGRHVMHRLRQLIRGTERRDRATRALATLLAGAATLVVALPGGGSAAIAAVDRDITGQSGIVVETYAASLPNDPNRCSTSIFVEFPDIQGATGYSTRILNRGFPTPREQTFGATPPNFPDDEYTVSFGPGFSKTFVAPAGRHRIFISGGSSGSGCTTTSWIDLLSMTASVESESEPPVASFTWEVRDGEPLTVDFDATGSSDDGTITSWAWDFGDTGSGAGETAEHPYAAGGTYPVTLTVTDDEGLTDSETLQVAVSSGGGDPEDPVAPVAAFTATVSASDPYTFLLDGSGSTDDGRIVTHEWDFDDGNTGSGASLPHTFPGHGTYDVSLTVTDDDGLEDTLVQQVLANAPPEPHATWSPSATEPLVIAVDASQSTDDSEIADYEWDFGDGTTGSGRTTTHEYAASGSYILTLVVTDDDGAEAETTVDVFVSGRGTYRLELPKVYGEEADLFLDEDGDVVAVECSFGSQVAKAFPMISKLAAGVAADCLGGGLGLATSEVPGGFLGGLSDAFEDAFDANKVFPQSSTDKPLAQVAKALGIENFSDSMGSLQGLVDKLRLPPAGDGVVSVTPPKKTGDEIAKLLKGVADGYQLVNQTASAMQAWAQGVQQLTPSTP